MRITLIQRDADYADYADPNPDPDHGRITRIQTSTRITRIARIQTGMRFARITRISNLNRLHGSLEEFQMHRDHVGEVVNTERRTTPPGKLIAGSC